MIDFKWKQSCGGWGPDYIETPNGDYEVGTDGKTWTVFHGGKFIATEFPTQAKAKAHAERLAAMQAPGYGSDDAYDEWKEGVV